MPLYEYKCLKCGYEFEVRQKITDPPVLIHGDCGGSVEQKLSPPLLQFKGTGFYETDYKKK